MPKYRHRVLGFLVLLFAITYIDRVCISVAGPRMQEDLGIDPVGWGWVTAMFTLSYCLFEIPTGALGDRIGPRRVLTRVVLWWSAFTSMTGMVSNDVYTFFQTWFHTFLIKGRGFSEATLVLSALPYVIATCSNLAGGAASDAMVRRLGVKWGRRSIGVVGLGTACLLTIAAMLTQQQILTVVLLSLVYGAITFQQSGVFGLCLDIGRKHAGSVVGLMNTSAQVGGFLSSIAYGYIVARFGYDAPFVPMAVLLLIGALLWLRIDASKELSAS